MLEEIRPPINARTFSQLGSGRVRYGSILDSHSLDLSFRTLTLRAQEWEVALRFSDVIIVNFYQLVWTAQFTESQILKFIKTDRKFQMACYGLNPVPLPATPKDMTVFGSRAFKGEIR